jgi:hypothetical protein
MSRFRAHIDHDVFHRCSCECQSIQKGIHQNKAKVPFLVPPHLVNVNTEGHSLKQSKGAIPTHLVNVNTWPEADGGADNGTST